MIEIRHVSKRFRTGKTSFAALHDISLTIERGEFTSILGPSGSGKSTLLQIVGGLDRPTSGSVSLDGENLRAMSDRTLAHFRNRRIGFVFQSFHLLPHATALENVMLPLIYSGLRLKRKPRAMKVLSILGLQRKWKNKSTELSGGEQQRVAIARALVHSPDIILADEPTGNLDSQNGAHIMDILSTLHQAGKTVIVVTHDVTLAARASRIIEMQDGRVL